MGRALVLARGGRAEQGTSRLLGLQITERVVVNLDRQGYSEIHVLGPRLVLPDGRRQDVAFHDEPADTLAVVRELLQGSDEDLLVVPGDVVYHPQLPEQLAGAAARAQRSLVAGDDPAHALVYIRGLDAERLPAAGRLEELATAVADASWGGEHPLGPREFVIPATDDAERRRAVRALLALNWRPHDGLAARYVNKHISVRISAWLADTPITPNAMTIGAFVIALVGIALTTWGTYAGFVLGTLLVQLQSILDGCDGELSRMRYQSSRFGAWMDTVVDDLLGVLWVAALGMGVYRSTGEILFLWAGMIASVLHLVGSGLIYVILIRIGGVGHQDFTWWFEEGEGEAEPTGAGSDAAPAGAAAADHSPRSPVGWAKYLIRRDFYVLLFLVLALVNLMPVALLLAVGGALALTSVTLMHVARRGLRG